MKIITKLLPISSLFFFAVACSSGPDKTKEKNFDFSQTTIWDNLNYEDAIVTKWRDGDTLEFQKDSGSIGSLRFAFIDTAETHKKDDQEWTDTQGLEYKWGKKAQDFAEEQIPINSKVRIVFFGGKSYDREIGSVFYGDNFEHNYSLSIIKVGLAVPQFNQSNLLSIGSPQSINHYIAYPLAETFNYAYDNQIGIYKNDLYKEIYLTRGMPNFNQFLKSKASEGNNIYSWIDDDYWK